MLTREQKLAILYEAQRDLLQAIEDVRLVHETVCDDSPFLIESAIANLKKLVPVKLPVLPEAK